MGYIKEKIIEAKSYDKTEIVLRKYKSKEDEQKAIDDLIDNQIEDMKIKRDEERGIIGK